jgi:hypothetical protein
MPKVDWKANQSREQKFLQVHLSEIDKTQPMLLQTKAGFCYFFYARASVYEYSGI